MEKEKKKMSKSKLIIIILLVVILAIVAVGAYMMISGKSFKDAKKMFESKDEYTIALDEFVTNLKNESKDKGKNYLKIQVALMYTDKKNTEIIEANISKIRDIILNDLREKSSAQILEVENTPKLKEKILEKINNSLGKKVIHDIYFTNLVVQ
ncbi:flagellar basal body-associated FliL family protein [Tissierella creatinophila]|uniref:Flagellar protein FliL n=1 Tax=Tissierella creatinophila DSM 6911 TaxID=1123403 RepID=A0A1U7M8V6_TISCR|nr:flagellar basal body-associated FliL family protein [Tissierella creatinophila]OLS03763.1 flagellar basal body-associated protein FliL [Tissierella creatinophila DSM 6911]